MLIHEPPFEQVLGSAAVIDTSRVDGVGPAGRLPLTPDMLRNEPSGTKLRADTRLSAVLQRASGGAWAGCIYDVDRIVPAIDAGITVRAREVDGTGA